MKKKIFLLLFGVLVALPCAQIIGQDIDRVYKEHGIWKGDISAPVIKYPIKGAIIADTSAIPDGATTPPPTPGLTSVDNVDTKFVYVGPWAHNGETNAPGFYGNTMAYTSGAGHTTTLIFNGTSIEVFCEKKAGHGSATFQLDGANSETVNLGVAGPVGSTSVYKKTVAAGEHTFKLSVSGSGNVVFDYVKINGTAVTPPTTPPPTTGEIVVQPGQSIKSAVESATSGKKVTIQAGTYNEPNITVPVGVSMEANGVVTITATTPGREGDAETGLLILKSSPGTQGNQTISGLTLEGNNVGYGGIIVDGRDKVTIKGCKVRNFNMHGVWIKNSKDSFIEDNDFYNTGWADTRYSSGNINIFALTRVTIQRNTIRTDKDKKGTGIEALWKESTMTDLKILNNTFALNHLNPWGNYQAKNFSIEIHDTHYNGIEIAYNNIGNQLSMASHKPATAATPGKTIIHHNTGDLGGDTMFLENICDNFEVYNNTTTNAQMYAANMQPNSVWKNNKFYNNTFTSSGVVSWGGLFLIGPLGVQGFSITNNTFNLKGNKFIVYMGVTGGVTESGNTFVTTQAYNPWLIGLIVILILIAIYFAIKKLRKKP